MAIDDYYKRISPLQAATNPITQQRNTDALDPALRNIVNNRAGGAQVVPASGGVVSTGGGPLSGASVIGALDDAQQRLPGALQAASDAKLKAFDSQIGLSEGYIGQLQQPNKSDMWGRFGAALLQPTSTGSFAEGFGNAATAAMDARAQYRDKEAERMDKLYRSQMALEALKGERPNEDLLKIDNTLTYYDKSNQIAGARGDYEIGNGLTPSDDDALIADYERNPAKYSGVAGRVRIEEAKARKAAAAGNAFDIYKMERQGEIDIAKERAKQEAGKDAYKPDSGTKKAIRENDAANVTLAQTMNNLKTAYELAGEDTLEDGTKVPRSNSGYWAKGRGEVAEYLPDGMVPDFIFGSKEQGRNTGQLAQIMDLEAIKNVGAYLKGPTSDRDVQLMLNTLADPDATPERKQAAIKRVMDLAEAEMKFNADYNKELKTGKAYGMEEGEGQGQPSITPQDVDTLKMAIEHAKSNNAYSGVAKKLNEMGYDITPEQLRSLTPEQLDKMIEEAN